MQRPRISVAAVRECVYHQHVVVTDCTAWLRHNNVLLPPSYHTDAMMSLMGAFWIPPSRSDLMPSQVNVCLAYTHHQHRLPLCAQIMCCPPPAPVRSQDKDRTALEPRCAPGACLPAMPKEVPVQIPNHAILRARYAHTSLEGEGEQCRVHRQMRRCAYLKVHACTWPCIERRLAIPAL